LTADAVDVPDEVAGQVHIAVVNGIDVVDLLSARQIVVKELGKSFMPEEVIKVEGLGLDEFSRTLLERYGKQSLGS